MWKYVLNKFARKSSKLVSSPGSETLHHRDSNATDGTSSSVGISRSGTVKKMSAAIFPSSVVAGIETLVSFKDSPSQENNNVFISKLNMCCTVFDFSNSSRNSVEKDAKRQTLVELVEFVSTASTKFTEPMVAASCRMFAANLFRVFPPNYRSNASGGGENEAEEPLFDPAWSHLQLVYDLMAKFIASSSLDVKMGKKYVDHAFILRLLDLFNSEDPRERDSLKTILHRVYGKFMVHRPFIRKAVGNIFFRFVFETEQHNGLAELLEVFGSVISGFAVPLKEEHKLFLWKALIPLHKPRTVGAYLQQLTYCVTQFIEKEPKLASSVIWGLLKYWPVTNSQKEVMFLSELEEVLEIIDVSEFQKCVVPLFRRIGCCLNSSHFQVAERALFLWNNDRFVHLVSQNRQVIMPIIFPALERNIRNHWNQAVHNVTTNVRKMLSEMDDELFMDCQKKFEEEEEQQKLKEEMRRLTWERLENAASIQPLSGNTAVLVTPAMLSPASAASRG